MQSAADLPLHRHISLSPGRYIRLLFLESSSRPTNSIICSLREVCLDDHSRASVPYEALSYVWGSPTGDQEIVCDGMRLLVTPNCFSALQHLRQRWCIRKLWIDAICIDQSSIPEKNRQVKLMGDVYKYARRVIIWLGWDGPLVEEEIRRFRILGAYLTALGIACKIFKCLTRFSSAPQIEAIPQSRTLALIEIAKNEWFNRVWTFQELCLARHPTIVFGRSSVSWEKFIKCLHFYHGSGIFLWPSWFRSNWMRESYYRACADVYSQGSNQQEISRLAVSVLHLSRQRRCENPLDKVNGLYQVFHDLGIDLPEPDYSFSVQQLYEDVTFSFIQNTRSLRVMEFTISQRRLNGLPSWVPDYSNPPWPATNDLYSVNLKHFPADLNLHRRSGMLELPGIFLGQVQSTVNRMQSKTISETTFNEDFAATLLTLYRWRMHVKDPQCSYTQRHENLFGDHITLLRPDCQKNSPAQIQSLLPSLFNLDRALENMFGSSAFLEDIERQQPGESRSGEVVGHLLRSVGHDVDSDALISVFSLLQSRLEGMILFITENGDCGLTTAQVSANDITVLFPGAAIPMLIRNSPDNEREFHLVGPASMSMISQEQWNRLNKPSDLQNFMLV